MRRLWVGWIVAGLIYLKGLDAVLYAQPAQQGAEQITKTIHDWGKRHKRFQTVRYVVSGKAERKDRPENSKLPAVRPLKYVVLLDFVRGRLRMEMNGSGPGPKFERYIPRVSIRAYDGMNFQTSVDRKVNELGPTNPDISLVEKPLEQVQIDNKIWPILFAHGVVPTVNKTARPDQLPIQHTTEEFEFRGEILHAGTRCIVLRTDPVASTPLLVDEFWIDPSRENAITRHIYFAGKNPYLRFDVSYQKSEHGWLPNSWIFAHSMDNKVAEVIHFNVDSVEVNPSVADDDFTLPIPPGSIVRIQKFPQAGQGLDPFKPSNGLFRVDLDGNWTNLEKSGFTTAEGIPLPPESRGLHWVWALVASLGLAGGAIGIARYRRRTRRITKS